MHTLHISDPFAGEVPSLDLSFDVDSWSENKSVTIEDAGYPSGTEYTFLVNGGVWTGTDPFVVFPLAPNSVTSLAIEVTKRVENHTVTRKAAYSITITGQDYDVDGNVVGDLIINRIQ